MSPVLCLNAIVVIPYYRWSINSKAKSWCPVLCTLSCQRPWRPIMPRRPPNCRARYEALPYSLGNPMSCLKKLYPCQHNCFQICPDWPTLTNSKCQKTKTTCTFPTKNSFLFPLSICPFQLKCIERTIITNRCKDCTLTSIELYL